MNDIKKNANEIESADNTNPENCGKSVQESDKKKYGDDWYMPPKINRIVVEYHRKTRILQKTFKKARKRLYVVIEGGEKLIIDRQEGTVEYSRNIGKDQEISCKCRLQRKVIKLLDCINGDYFFEYVFGDSDDAADTPNNVRDYVITLDIDGLPQRVISGSFDRNNLPDDYYLLAEPTKNFLQGIVSGDILNSCIYEKERRLKGEYVYCSVNFNEYSDSYYYIADDDDYMVGDLVNVPAGINNRVSVAKITEIGYFLAKDVPFPLEKTKHIIGKYKKKRR